VLTIEADVRSGDDLQRMATTVKEQFGGLDILFANAGVAFVTPLGKTTEELFDKLMVSASFSTPYRELFASDDRAEPHRGG
jgi:NAD(P)-dependent dehydrogenase (short-subunit alcohol dehydrogenase family)